MQEHQAVYSSIRAAQVQAPGSQSSSAMMEHRGRPVGTALPHVPHAHIQSHPPLRHVLGGGAPDQGILELSQQALMDALAKVLHAGAAAVVTAHMQRSEGEGGGGEGARRGSK